MKKYLHDKIFNEHGPAKFLIELAFGSSNIFFSGTRPLNYILLCNLSVSWWVIRYRNQRLDPLVAVVMLTVMN